MGHTRKVPFCLLGQLEGYELGKSGKVRRLRIETGQGVFTVKLSPESCIDLLRGVLSKSIQRGSWLKITGLQKIDLQGVVKSRKALRIVLVPSSSTLDLNCLGSSDSQAAQSSSQTKILLCQKSSCRKQGSEQLQRVIEQYIGDLGLDRQVCVKAIGCLKHCSKGPNLIINKQHYRNVSLKDAIALLDQHFASQQDPVLAL